MKGILGFPPDSDVGASKRLVLFLMTEFFYLHSLPIIAPTIQYFIVRMRSLGTRRSWSKTTPDNNYSKHVYYNLETALFQVSIENLPSTSSFDSGTLFS
jgi:hypothetical protein